MDRGRRLHAGRLRLLPDPQRDREGRLQLRGVSQGQRVPGGIAGAAGMAGGSEAAGTVGVSGRGAGQNPSFCIELIQSDASFIEFTSSIKGKYALSYAFVIGSLSWGGF